MKAALEALIKLFYPDRCIFCLGLLEPDGSCSCRREVEMKCRLSLGRRETRFRESWPSFVISSYIYRDPVPEAVANFKFRGFTHAANEMARVMAEDAADYPELGACHLVVPVPSYRGRTLHGLVLAREFAKAMGLPFDPKAVKKTRETKKQHELDPRSRRTNLKDAFAADERVKGLRVIICDDVLTSGSTILELASVLRAAGAEEVYAVTFARAGNKR